MVQQVRRASSPARYRYGVQFSPPSSQSTSHMVCCLCRHLTGLAVDDFGSLSGTDRPEPRRRVKLLFLDRNVTKRNSIEGAGSLRNDSIAYGPFS
jgi:hypothetical protein